MAPQRSSGLRRFRTPGLLVLLLLAAWLLAPLVPAPRTVSQFRATVYGSTGVFFALVVALIASLVPWLVRIPARRLALVAVLALACVVLLNLLRVPIASDLAKITLGVSAGVGLVAPLDRPWWLLPISVCVPLADAWSVFSSKGVTHAVVERAATQRAWIDWPTIATPIAGYDYLEFGRIGIVDILFVALFVAAAQRWQLGVGRLLVALPLAFVATTVLAYEREGQAVPALPILCLGFLACTLPALVRDLRDEFRRRGTAPGDSEPGAPDR